MNLPALLAKGLADLGVEVPPEAQSRLLQFLVLLQKWQSVFARAVGRYICAWSTVMPA